MSFPFKNLYTNCSIIQKSRRGKFFSKIAFLPDMPYNFCQMKPKINIDHVCVLAHLKLTEGEKPLEQARRIDRKKLPLGFQTMGIFFSRVPII